MGNNKTLQAEKKTFWVIILTLITMFAEIFVGYVTHSMALFADGCHMGTHALALSLTFFTYILIRKLASSDKFAFGTGKFSTLSGFASSIILGITGILIIFESVERFLKPEQIGFNEAIIVAVVGLIVNAASILIMGDNNHHHHHHHNHSHEHCEHHEDYNFKAAYMHILADALTSIFAIAALLAGKYFNWIFLDPVVGFIGGTVICIWAFNLIKSTSAILVDCENKEVKDKIINTLKDNAEFETLRVWSTSEDKVSIIGKINIINRDLTLEEIKNKIGQIADCETVILETTQPACRKIQ